ncbi:hypothetical protein DFH06DRAFT_1354073, partial [Mycena polygramma]
SVASFFPHRYRQCQSSLCATVWPVPYTQYHNSSLLYASLGALIMVTDSPPEEGALLMPDNDLDSRFSFTSCPSHGFVCITNPGPHENNQDTPKHLVYPSPPPTASQPKRNVPLPAAARQQHFGGILDSPVVFMKAPATHMPLSPPPTIPTPTHALPPSDADAPQFASSLLLPIAEHESPQQKQLSPISPEWTLNCKPQDNLFAAGDSVLMSQPPSGAFDQQPSDADAPQFASSSLLLPIAEHESPQQTQSQLLSPISPEWAPNCKPEDDLFAVDDSGDCVLMSQPPSGAFDYSFAGDADTDDDILATAGAFGRPALHPLDIPMYHGRGGHAKGAMHGEPVLLGFPGMMPHRIEDQDATSPFDYLPPSPSSSRDFDSASESDLDDLDLSMDVSTSPGPSSYSPSPLLSFDPLPSPDLLDDLDFDMALGPGLGMSPSPSRRSVACLPDCEQDDFAWSTEWSDAGASSDTPSLTMSTSPPHSPPHAFPVNALCLELPADPLPSKAPPPPSILDAFSPADLALRLPPGLPDFELTALLAVRARAYTTLAACTAGPPPCGAPGDLSLSLDHELRRTVPRDTGEPRRRRKRAKELGREVDALVGLALGLLPDSGEQRRAKTCAAGTHTVKREKAGLAGLASVPQLVARMILRRRERCVRGLEGAGRARVRNASPLRQCFGEEGDEPPPSPLGLAAMDMEIDGCA